MLYYMTIELMVGYDGIELDRTRQDGTENQIRLLTTLLCGKQKKQDSSP